MLCTSFVLILVFVKEIESGLPPPAVSVCPAIQCPEKIKKLCRKPEFVFGSDGQTMCRVCDSNLCKTRQEVCPQIQCPNDNSIKDLCRKAEFVMGTDGITRCRVCDSNLCVPTSRNEGPKSVVCPQIQCPNLRRIPRRCRVKQFSVGLDGITRCRMCPRNRCRPPRRPQ